MCLINLDIEKTKKIRNSTNPIICWKIVSSGWKSPYCGTQYTLGINKSNRKSPRLSSKEQRVDEVNRGLHCYTTRADARNSKEQFEIILKCSAEPKDLVAVGRFGSEDCYVFTKVAVICDQYGKTKLKHA